MGFDLIPVQRIPVPDWAQTAPVRAVLAALQQQYTGEGPAALFVGGCVRNAVLGEAVSDIDMATPLVPADMIRAAKAAGIKVALTGIAHGTLTLIADHMPFQVTTLREDVETDGRHARVAFSRDWVADAQRRDFTMNTLLMDGDGNIYDPLGSGLADLQARQVRFVGDAAARIREDYLRMIRFFRFYGAYGRGVDVGVNLGAGVADLDALLRDVQMKNVADSSVVDDARQPEKRVSDGDFSGAEAGQIKNMAACVIGRHIEHASESSAGVSAQTKNAGASFTDAAQTEHLEKHLESNPLSMHLEKHLESNPSLTSCDYVKYNIDPEAPAYDHNLAQNLKIISDFQILTACQKATLTDFESVISPERVTEELKKIIKLPNAAYILALMRGAGVLPHLLTKIDIMGLNCYVALEIKSGQATVIPRFLWFAGLDAQAFTAFARQMRFSRAETLTGTLVLSALSEFESTSEKSLKSLIYNYDFNIVTAAVLIHAVQKNTHDVGALDSLRDWRAPVFPLSGNDLMKIGVMPGPGLGAALKALEIDWIESDFSLNINELKEKAKAFL